MEPAQKQSRYVIDPASAQLTLRPDGTCKIDDPKSNYTVDVTVIDGTIRSITVSVRPGSRPGSRVTASAMSRIPTEHIRRAWEVLTRPGDASDDSSTVGCWWMQNTALSRQHRSWEPEHWREVLRVFDSAEPRHRYQAVADRWGVTKSPTAYRWVRRARELKASGLL